MEWIEIWQSPVELEALAVRDLLENHGIPVQLLNQKDTAYIFLGSVRCLVPINLEKSAHNLLVINGFTDDVSIWN